MISTLAIQTALQQFLQAGGLFEKVTAHSDTNLEGALSALRDTPTSLAVIVPGEDQFRTEFVEGLNIPMFGELSCSFSVLICGRSLDMRETGSAGTLDLKDKVFESLIWENLGIPDLIVVPLTNVPLAIEFEDGTGREAWQMNLSVRQILQTV